MPCTVRSEPTRRAVQDFPWPVRIPIRFSDAAISSSDHRPAMLRITARASSGVRQPWSPVLGFLTRSCECWPPRQWIVRTTSRAASSTSAMMSAIRARRSLWRARMLTPGAFHAASRSSAARQGPARWRSGPRCPIAHRNPRRSFNSSVINSRAPTAEGGKGANPSGVVDHAAAPSAEAGGRDERGQDGQEQRRLRRRAET